MVVEKTADRRTGANYLTLFGIIIVLILPLLALAHILSSRRKLRRESQPGRAASASVLFTGTPLTTFNRYGSRVIPSTCRDTAWQGRSVPLLPRLAGIVPTRSTSSPLRASALTLSLAAHTRPRR